VSREGSRRHTVPGFLMRPGSPLLRGGRPLGCRRGRVVTEPLRIAPCQLGNGRKGVGV